MIFRILVVDDEATMRKGITNFMNWDSLNCQVVGSAENGIVAMDFLKKNDVDIVLTDIKMPGADGLELARFIHNEYPHIKVIILTAYADFEYAKAAIKYNVVSFIVKPTNKTDLFDAVKKAQEQIIISRNHSSVAKEEIAFLRDQLLREMTTMPYAPSFVKRLSKLSLNLNNYYVAAFQLVPLENDIAALKKIIIDEKKNAYCYRYNNLIITIYFLDNFEEQIPEYIIQNCQEISTITEMLDSKHVAIGISHCHQNASDFRSAVAEAIHALTQSFYSEKNIFLFSDYIKSSDYDLTAENSFDLFQFENHLFNRLFEDAEQVLKNIFSKFRNNFVSSSETKNICFQIYYICYRVLKKKDAIPPSSELLTKIQSAPDIFILENAVNELLQYTKNQFSGSNSAQNRIIENTIKFIHQNLASVLSLEIIAENLHISASHLSRTFKKYCDESLTEYINKTRIEKAKEYLKDSTMLTYEIANQVGYNDATYFSSIFKKHTGFSPSEYRQKYAHHQDSSKQKK